MGDYEYKCWDEAYGEGESLVIDSMMPDWAAEEYILRLEENGNILVGSGQREATVIVVCLKTGERTKWRVTGQLEPVYDATEIGPDEESE